MGRRKLTLDCYIDFVDRHGHLDLPVELLDQIIGMHGFKKLAKTKKEVLIEALGTMELMDPCRSTVDRGDVSSCVLTTLKEVIKDLKDLGWQECCVTSLQTLNSVEHDPRLQNGDVSTSASRPPKKLSLLRDTLPEDPTGGTVGECDSASASSLVVDAKKLAPGKKRKR